MKRRQKRRALVRRLMRRLGIRYRKAAAIVGLRRARRSRRVVYHVIYLSNAIMRKVPGLNAYAPVTWGVKRASSFRLSRRCATKEEAVAVAKLLAMQNPLGQIVVHGRDGRIQYEHTYGWDPVRHKG